MLFTLLCTVLLTVTAQHCDERKMDCKQGCPSGWYVERRENHGCCASFGNCGGNRAVCRRPCDDVVHCQAHGSGCNGCRKNCAMCNHPYSLVNNECIIPQSQIYEATGFWVNVGSCNAECNRGASVGVSSESGTEFTTEESTATSVEASATIEAEVGGDAAGGTVGGSGTVTAGQVDTYTMSQSISTTIGQDRGHEASIVCNIADYPWGDPGGRLYIYQYQYIGKTRSNGNVLLKTYDWLCIPVATGIVPKCPPNDCHDAVCTLCPDFGRHTSELPDCTDNFSNCAPYVGYCNNVYYADWFLDNCKESCGFCSNSAADGKEAKTEAKTEEKGGDANPPPVTEGIVRTGLKVSKILHEDALEHFAGTGVDSADSADGYMDAPASFMKVGPVSEGVSGGLVAVTVIAVLGAVVTCAYLARRVTTLKRQEGTQMMNPMPAEHVTGNSYDVVA